MKLPDNLHNKLQVRKQDNSLRTLPVYKDSIDFASNDYLGYAKNEALFKSTHQFLVNNNFTTNGATGSRLISGNHAIYSLSEKFISEFHQSECALIFNSGYDANVGFFASVPQRGDVIFFDELCHASIRDGFMMSNAKSYKYNHNDLENLRYKIASHKSKFDNTTIYIVTESVFSMDGDSPNLEQLSLLADQEKCYLVVDEAHALGVFGDYGEGLVQSLGLQDKVFARIITFGKGLGCHGAAILCSNELCHYLINFCRSFIYTTGLSPHSVASIFLSYQKLSEQNLALKSLKENICFFNQEKWHLGLNPLFVYSKSAIQCAIIKGNKNVKNVALQLQEKGFDVKPILSPTVPEGQERLRFCLHSYNSREQISEVLNLLAKIIF